MEISLRLKTVADQVFGKTVADIGTDHGYVPIYLVEKGKSERAIACDINKGPLLKAEENIRCKGLEDKIEIRLGSGLLPIKKGEVETAVIAGMGGMLMTDILKESDKVVESLKQLVLQPQLDIDAVRKYVHSIGFRIINEEMLIDEGKYYTVISAVHGEEEYEREAEYAFGKINLDKKCPVLKRYLEHRVKKLLDIEDGLMKAGTKNSLKKLEEVRAEIGLHKEALREYEVL